MDDHERVRTTADGPNCNHNCNHDRWPLATLVGCLYGAERPRGQVRIAPPPDRSARRGGEARRPDELGRNAGNDRVGWHVFGNDRASADDCAVADRHAWDDRYPGTEPHLAADRHRRWDHVGPPVWVDAVVQSRQGAAMADEGAVPDRDAPGVLEATSDVDEDVLAECQ